MKREIELNWKLER